MIRQGLTEKRRTKRVYIRIPVTCEIIDPQDKSIKHKTVTATDISLEGIYIETDEIFPLNTQLDASFQLPKSNYIIHVTLRTVRVETTRKENIFGIGAIFTNLSDKDKSDINQLVQRSDINRLLDLAIKNGASDLHLVTNSAPVLRIHGEIETLGNFPRLDAEDIPRLVYSIMNKVQIRRFEQEKELDFGIQYDIRNRFRVNVHQQRGFLEATFRLIDTNISSFQELMLPDVVKDLARIKDGLILIGGPTGSGKTTTIAAMIELINQERKAVVITLERPIEYVHTNDKSIIKQREVGIDTNSFSIALKNTLRQDSNVIVVGELEDMETIRTAIIAAEAGHLVIASFHAPNTVQAIDRLTILFPPENKREILAQLSNCLKGVITQLLIPRKDRQGRILTTEALIVNDAVKRVIRNDELFQLPSIIQTGGPYKMQSMHDSIKRYLQQGLVDEETANFYSQEFSRQYR